MLKRINLLCVLFLAQHIFAITQEIEVPEDLQPELVIKARAKKNSILLRWGVTDKLAWKYGNEYGYIVERTTVFRDDAPLQKAEKVILTGTSIKPRPLIEWENIAQTNTMAAVAAQAIYGETFTVNNTEDENLVLRVINESSELDQRFGFSMFAIDQDFEAAQFAGLGFVDETVKPNERYLYKVNLAAPKDLITVKEAGLIIAPSKLEGLVKPYDFAGYVYNNAFILIWEYDALESFYGSYDLEKSTDGISFSKINETPITKLAITETSGISYTDSIAEYGKKYWYRINGRTIFNEVSPSSDNVTLIAYKELLVVPEVKEHELLSEKEVILKWGFDEEESWKLTGFDVLRANKAIGPYQTVEENLEKEARSYRYNQVKDINYFKIRAKGIAQDHQDSSPIMVQPIDSIPPKTPIGLAGTIDTLGVVRLLWNKNTELDLRGYSILRANRPNQEFTRLNKNELSENNFQDTINLKTFNKKVFYRVMAADQRYNESEPSTILALERPSKIPPVSPVFNSYEVMGDTILLKWIGSSSENISKQIIYRKQAGAAAESPWENVYESEKTDVFEFNDINTNPNTKYLYTITAINSNDIESNPSPPLSITTQQTLLKPQVKGLFANVDRENKFIQLSWRYKEDNITEIQVYRKEGDNEFSLYEVFANIKNRFIDTKVIANSTYTYGFKAVFNDGSISEWNEIKVIY